MTDFHYSGAANDGVSVYGKLVSATAAHRASVLQDIQRGRKTEIDALNGAVIALGKKLGVSTPVNEVIAALVKAKENLALQTQRGRLDGEAIHHFLFKK